MGSKLEDRSILQPYIKDGFVNYQQLMSDGWLEKKILELESAETPDHQTFEEFSFWLDTYNLLTLHAVSNELNKNPNWKGNLSLWSKIKFFYLTKYTVAGKKISLYTLENKILRKRFKDPRLHFAINCASISCPVLPNKLFSDVMLDEYLEELTYQFINDQHSVILEGPIIRVNRIFKWYKKDFKNSGGVISFIQKYWKGEPIPNDVIIKYLDYDWHINSQ
ncbi:MAG: DUF547 domain-containing protein [Candidatus Kariarchaeaceae archaeon]|jgi:hypothetical protein